MQNRIGRPAAVEAVESRIYFAGVAATLANGTLTITGTPAADVIRLQVSAGKLAITGVTQAFPVASFSRITVNALAGNDTVDGSNAPAPVTVDAGVGDDVVLGGQSDDSLLGNDGADTLFGGRGRDTLRGGAGNDYLNAGPGEDSLFGDAGNDQFYSVDGVLDRIDGGAGFDRVKTDFDDLAAAVEAPLA
jgi:Ca2+-binding RTX toxin-like protein